jgi:hypothetical protein
MQASLTASISLDLSAMFRTRHSLRSLYRFAAEALPRWGPEIGPRVIGTPLKLAQRIEKIAHLLLKRPHRAKAKPSDCF